MTIDTTVPQNESPTAQCPYCDRPFTSETLRALHIGETHPTECTAAEHDAYDEAYDAESDELFVYHLKVVAALILLYGAFTMLYTIAWT